MAAQPLTSDIAPESVRGRSTSPNARLSPFNVQFRSQLPHIRLSTLN